MATPPESHAMKKTLILDRRDVEKFTKLHPGHGAFTAFVRSALQRYLEVNDVDPDELISLAVGEFEEDS